MGLALMAIHQKESIDAEIYAILKKVGADLIPKFRYNILKHLFFSEAVECNSKWLQTTEVSTDRWIHGTTALRTLQDLIIIGLVRGRKVES
jgi:hypothetical protein